MREQRFPSPVVMRKPTVTNNNPVWIFKEIVLIS